MATPRLGYIVTFDISFDGYRRRAGHTLERHGPRILHSVYDIDVTEDRIGRLTDRLTDIVEAHDHVLVLPYCGDCRSAWSGIPLDAAPANGWVITS